MPYNIAMTSDFFYPQPGGVESHMYQLATKLIDRGHKVIIITHSYKTRHGVRYLTNGLKVYYVPFFVIYRESTLPTVFSFFPIFRNILIREKIDIVHGHASLSSLCHEAILHARTMGLRTCFTDHSLFGFADAASILTNKLLKFTLSDVDHVICVSHTCKENTVLRAALDPSMVSVIPNAVVAENFKPDPTAASKSHITIVVISRLFYNKGTDLLVAAIPRICELHPSVHFIIAGSGPKAIDLEQMLEKHMLQDRVQMLGPVRHEEYWWRLQAAGYMLPEEDDLVSATSRAIKEIRMGRVKTEKFHEQVKSMYSWTDVAERTERVYEGICTGERVGLMERLKRYYGCGIWAGKLFVLCVVVDSLILVLLEFLFPQSGIDTARSWPTKAPRMTDGGGRRDRSKRRGSNVEAVVEEDLNGVREN
ncbi:uncharacterized protein LAJ45_06852 [Morchella importuna]|uniref:uncharacterized protein n=1 Tax=Morchella importuna TaxID=1174673 RepID=UPI001E8DE3B6|nr:uncharacterized protein LAJ45_06852 [Morchella importuna]KAH8149312.1 hypothetical protein LAJ45_06852 [Morchella importuna]